MNTRAARQRDLNLGMYGVREFSAIINPPHATILARRRRAPPGGGETRRRRRLRQHADRDALLRSPRGRRHARAPSFWPAFRGYVEQPVTALV